MASWADRTAYRFFDGKFGIGGRRIASAFPAKDRWREMAVRALEEEFRHDEPSQDPCSQCAKKQSALQRLEALLGHLRKEMVERRGERPATWREGVRRAHAEREFQGILASASPRPVAPILSADDVDDSTTIWNPPAQPTLRQVADVVKALEPLLRFATEVRFVDPYLDASVAEFFEPLAALIGAAQQRRSAVEVRLEFHTASNRERITGQSRTPVDIAREIAADCTKAFAQVLKKGTSLRVFVWSEAMLGAEKIHNRYVLTNVGGVSVPAGLDRARPRQAHTDDFTVLSRQQHQLRWAQYCEGSRKLVLGPAVVNGTA